MSRHGALPMLYAAVGTDVAAGGYYGPDGIAEMKGHPTAARIPKRALDVAAAKRLWMESERLTAVRFSPLSDAN